MRELNQDTRQTVNEIGEELMALKPNSRKLQRQMFSELYPFIVEQLDAGVTQKAILELLAKHDLKLHPAKFKKMMHEESVNAGGQQDVAVEEGMQ